MLLLSELAFRFRLNVATLVNRQRGHKEINSNNRMVFKDLIV